MDIKPNHIRRLINNSKGCKIILNGEILNLLNIRLKMNIKYYKNRYNFNDLLRICTYSPEILDYYSNNHVINRNLSKIGITNYERDNYFIDNIDHTRDLLDEEKEFIIEQRKIINISNQEKEIHR